MTFMPQPGTRIVPGTGLANAKIVLVGEAPGAHEDRELRPFVGPAGSVLDQCLHTAGLIRPELYITNVVKTRPRNNDISPFFSTTTSRFTPEGIQWIEKLKDELNEVGPNIIVTLGQTAMAALLGMGKVMKYRGYLFESRILARPTMILPTIHPAAALRGMYIYRHLIAADLRKARELSEHSTLQRPQRQLIWNFQTVTEVLEWLDYYTKQDIVCFDIEVTHFEVACICFSSAPDIAISVPFDSRWTLDEELLIWRGIQRVLGNPKSVKVVQNGMFDIHFLLTRYGIETAGPIKDTMVAHHIVYPELPKGLAFLGSIYCGTQAYWKDAVKFDNIKQEA